MFWVSGGSDPDFAVWIQNSREHWRRMDRSRARGSQNSLKFVVCVLAFVRKVRVFNNYFAIKELID
eukprot:10971851-Alexandrium_andersonii.AAC.1